ncbi:hypothetical protein Tco_0121956 [Tanacetum coccineum]
MEQMTSICDMVGQIMQKKEEERRIAEDQAAKDRYWKIPICYDDDEDYTIAITPVLSTKEPVDSLIMEDEHLDTIPATELDEVIKSSVEELVLIPSESEGISDGVCDVPLCDNPTPLKAFKDHSEIVVNSNDDDTSSDDDDFEDIEYVEASPPDLEIVSLEEVNDVDQEKEEFDLENILQIQDVILREKLLNINRLIANIESLNDNSTPNCVLKSPSSFPIPDSNSFIEKSDTSLFYSDNSLPEFESFTNHTEETTSGSTTTHANNSLPEYDRFNFEIEGPIKVQRIENKAKTVYELAYERRRSSMTSVPVLPPVSGALSPIRADLIPSPKRVRDSGYLEDVEVDPRETSLRDDLRLLIERRVRRVRGARLRSELRGLRILPEDIPEPALEGAVEVTYETLGDFVQRFHDHTEAIPVHCIHVIKGVQREQGHRIVGVELAVTALTERIVELERDNRRIRGITSVESQRVDRL